MMAAKRIPRWFWPVTAWLLVLGVITSFLGHASITALLAPFPINQDDSAYLLYGQLGQILHSNQVPGRDFISYPAWGPIWVLSLASRLFLWSAEASQSVNILLQHGILWVLTIVLLSFALRPVLTRRDAVLSGTIMTSVLICLAPVEQEWAISAPELTLFSCVLILACVPFGLWLLGTRWRFLTGLLWFPCLLWPPAAGGAAASVLLLAMIGQYRHRIFRLIGTIIFGIIGTIIGLWFYTDGNIPVWLGRVVALNSSQHWNLPPFGQNMRLWDGVDLLHHLATKGGLALGALMIGCAGMLLSLPHLRRGWHILLMLHLCFILAAIAQSWISHPDTVFWHATTFSALACLLRMTTQTLAPYARKHMVWVVRPAVTIAAIWLCATTLPALPEKFNSRTAIDRGRCLMHLECGKPVADRTAAFIDAQRTWGLIDRSKAEHRVIAAWPTWINIMLGIKTDLPTIWAHHAVRGLQAPWLDALKTRPYDLSVTEAPGIFRQQPWMIHQLWWFYRQIARKMVPVEYDYRYVFWMRRNQGADFIQAPVECFITLGMNNSQIIVPAPRGELNDDKNTLYELRLGWEVPAAPGRFLVLADKPGLFQTTGGVSLDPTTKTAIIPLRSLQDITILRAISKHSLPINVTNCQIWQLYAPDANAALWTP